MLWLTQSNAYSVSQNMPPAIDLLFIALKIPFVSVSVALPVVRFFLKPYCSELKILY
jgi:hypothetical protein